MDERPPGDSPSAPSPGSPFSFPGCLLAVGLVLLFLAAAFGVYFVVPRYEARWADLGGPPSAAAGALVLVSRWFVRFWWLALGALVAGLIWRSPWRR